MKIIITVADFSLALGAAFTPSASAQDALDRTALPIPEPKSASIAKVTVEQK